MIRTKLGLLGAVLLVLSACASYTPLELQPVDGMAPGPGLFSGEDGEFVIFQRKQ